MFASLAQLGHRARVRPGDRETRTARPQRAGVEPEPLAHGADVEPRDPGRPRADGGGPRALHPQLPRDEHAARSAVGTTSPVSDHGLWARQGGNVEGVAHHRTAQQLLRDIVAGFIKRSRDIAE